MELLCCRKCQLSVLLSLQPLELMVSFQYCLCSFELVLLRVHITLLEEKYDLIFFGWLYCNCVCYLILITSQMLVYFILVKALHLLSSSLI